MRLRRFHIVFLLFLFCGSARQVNAQQDPMYSMYMFDKMLINPGYTGSASTMVGTVKYRAQFAGLEGNPTTQTVNFHAPLKNRKVGLGFKVVNDQIAIIKNLNASAFYSYHLFVGGGKLSFGLETGIYNRSIEYGDLVLNQLGDQAIPDANASALVPDASWGVYYHRNQFYGGFSQNHILHSNFKDVAEGTSQSHLYTHTNLLVGNLFEFNRTWGLEPSILLKSVSGAPAQLDLNATLYYKELLGAGLQYRTGDAIGAYLRVNINEQLRVAYGYDMTVSGFSDYSGGAHEIVISYGIDLPPPPAQKEVHPRYYY